MNLKCKSAIKDEIILFDYIGVLSHNIISALIDILIKECEIMEKKMSSSINLFTIFTELLEIISNYKNSFSFKDMDKCFVKVSLIDGEFHIQLTKRLKKEQKRNLEENYFEGASFCEIVKRCDSFKYSFDEINEQEYQFSINVTAK